MIFLRDEYNFCMSRRHAFLFLIFYLCTACGLAHAENDYAYSVEFRGVDEETVDLLSSASQLVILQDRPPSTAATLKMRIDDDIPNLLKALQSEAYYNAKVDVAVDQSVIPIHITLTVNPGSVYPFASFKIVAAEDSCGELYPCDTLEGEDLGITLGEPAYPDTIIDAEEELISWLEHSGYPLAKLAKREVIADQATYSIAVVFYLDRGPLALFGETTISGNKLLLPEFFAPKIAWCEGEVYNPALVQRTMNFLELSGLFSSINISHDEELQEDGTLPMHIVVKEAKTRTLAFGLGYATDWGAGVNFEWEHRNLWGLGEKLSLVSNLWWIKQAVLLRYVKPDFLCPRQDLIWTLEATHEDIKPYREISFSASGILERQLNDRLRVSYGGMFTYLNNSDSVDNGNFYILKAPLQLFWNGANSLLDPTRGMTVQMKTAPALQLKSPCFGYTTNLLTFTAYKPFDTEGRFVFAAKATFGTIWGASRGMIPPSERFYAGSDTLLRGYHYMTVGPLNCRNKPIGGRSVMVYSFEMRMRIKDPFGLVLFYDLGNVYSQTWPQFTHKQLQSAGFGLRYHTPVGPIRLDVAFPFNPRAHLDKGYQIYFSIGQTF